MPTELPTCVAALTTADVIPASRCVAVRHAADRELEGRREQHAHARADQDLGRQDRHHVPAARSQPRKAGRLREDAAFADIGLFVVRLSQKLPGPFTEEAQMELAHRHADLVIAGLRAAPS